MVVGGTQKWVWLSCLMLVGGAGSQSNYDQQALSIELPGEGEGLPEFGTLNGTVTELDTLSPSITLNRTDANLGCGSGYMSIQLKFKQEFYGIVYADYDRNSPCKISGNGGNTTKIQLPLKGCGTVQNPTRVFTNNIIVRFHPGLEIDGDEVITVICRYPPPIVQIPLIPALLQLPLEPIGALQPLREFEILLIICAIVFLGLMLMGIGCSYYCLKKRNIRVIRRRPLSTIGSDVTKISEPPSMFEGLKIPRAHATDTSGSEEMTESVHTDYASDVTSIATVEDFQSAYSDLGGEVEENIVYPDIHEPPMPAFDTKMRVKKKAKEFTPMSSRASSVTDVVLAAQEQYLTTILERTETNTKETLERVRKSKAELGPPPVHARLRVSHHAPSITGRDSDSESQYSHDPLGTDLDFTEDEMAQHTTDYSTNIAKHSTGYSTNVTNVKQVDLMSLREQEIISKREEEIRERNLRKEKEIRKREPEFRGQNSAIQGGFDVTVRTTTDVGGFSDNDTASMSEYTRRDEEIRDRNVRKGQQIIGRKEEDYSTNMAKLSTGYSSNVTNVKQVDLMSLREQEIISRREEEIRERNLRKEQEIRKREPELRGQTSTIQGGFDVTVRTTTDVGGFSDNDTASMSEYTSQEPIQPVLIDRSHYSVSELKDLQSQFSGHVAKTSNHKTMNKFDVLIRVLDAPPPGASGHGGSEKDDLTSMFSQDDRQLWRDIVTHDTTFRTMIESAQTTDDVQHAISQIRYVTKYEKLFSPHKWDVIVRVLKAPGSISGKSISSKSSRTFMTEGSKSGTEYDLRSVAETTVNFGRSDFDRRSSVSGAQSQGRSMADRSGAEITEYHTYSRYHQGDRPGSRSSDDF